MMNNAWGWPLPSTDALLADSPYEPLDGAGENIAERLVMLAHLGYNPKVWSGRLDRYWDGFAERIEGACNTPTVAGFWAQLTDDLAAESLHLGPLLHEKNLLCHPAQLTPPVEDADVLAALRAFPRDLVDRARMWSKVRRDARKVLDVEHEEAVA